MSASTTDPSAYFLFNDVSYTSKASHRAVTISPGVVVEAVVGANVYLNALRIQLEELKFPLFTTLGQRNLSGFVGEVFSRVFCANVAGYAVNPHADGRPDILDVSTAKAAKHFETVCFSASTDGELAPIRSRLAPFEFGGIEVKSTIGNPVSGYKDILLRDHGVTEFHVGMPRVSYLASITFWGHHMSCENLLGLYYDYCEELAGTPQIIAVMHSELDCDVDWHQVSVGKTGSKKTSNTSLSGSGIGKISGGIVTVRNHPQYLDRLKQAGLDI